MSDYKNYGKATIYSNEDANSENKRPNLSGSIEVKEDNSLDESEENDLKDECKEIN